MTISASHDNSSNPDQIVLGVPDTDSLPKEIKQQLEQVDLKLIQKLTQSKQEAVDWHEISKKAKPPQAFRLAGPNRFSREEAESAGRKILAQGKIGVILVAGGQGTRLGFDRPKGMFPIGPVSRRTLFEVLIDQVKALAKSYRVPIPIYVMTSPATHAETVEYFQSNQHFNLSPEDLTIFCQGTMPAVDIETGKLLRSSDTELALSPNGHGGMLSALCDSGCLQSALDRGLEHLFYAQIDNPLAQICNEELIGYHALANSEMTTQVVNKAHALERVGNVVEIDGKVQIIEYSDLPDQYAQQQDEHGKLLLWAGNIAVHVFSTQFLAAAAASDSSLPFHLAQKKVPFVDAQGVLQNPETPNAYKFEKFIFDLLPLAQNAIAVEVDKTLGFAPVKNAEGAPADTASLAQQAISDLHKSWLRDHGTVVADQALVEIHPEFAHSPESLSKKALPAQIEEDIYLTSNSV